VLRLLRPELLLGLEPGHRKDTAEQVETVEAREIGELGGGHADERQRLVAVPFTPKLLMDASAFAARIRRLAVYF